MASQNAFSSPNDRHSKNVGKPPTIIHTTAPHATQPRPTQIIVNKIIAPAGATSINNEQQRANDGHATITQTVYPVQYIDTAGDAQVFLTTNGQLQYATGDEFQLNGLGNPSTVTYNPVTYYTSGHQLVAAPITQHSAGGYIVHTAGQSPVVGTTLTVTSTSGAGSDNSSAEQRVGGGHASLAQNIPTPRASPATVQWLLDNYETADGVSLPRCTLYSHYLRHCAEHRMEPMNPASLGKLVRSVFLGLRTRRLGTRGNSKYHYYGIRIKPDSPLNQFPDDQFSTQNWSMQDEPEHVGMQVNKNPYATMQLPYANAPPNGRPAAFEDAPAAKRFKTLSGNTVIAKVEVPDPNANNANANVNLNLVNATQSVPAVQKQIDLQSSGSAAAANLASANVADSTQAASVGVNNQQFLGDTVAAKPRFRQLTIDAESEQALADASLTRDDVRLLETAYTRHCEQVLDAVGMLQFNFIESLWRAFWLCEPTADTLGESTDSLSGARESSKLTRELLSRLCALRVVNVWVKECDYRFYQNLVFVLVPDVLRPIPSSLTQAIRNFAKSLESWMRSALHGHGSLPDSIVREKLSVAAAFAQTLRRYTSLNHLAQAARAVLSNGQQISQMLADLNRIDFSHIEEQANWVCQCDVTIVRQVQDDFKRTLMQQSSLDSWAIWLETVCAQVLTAAADRLDAAEAARGAAADENEAAVRKRRLNVSYLKEARLLLLKWSYYSSMVIRDLTLRSAASFGSFHLIRLLIDEYLFYLVEHKLAEKLGKRLTPLQIMNELHCRACLPLGGSLVESSFSMLSSASSSLAASKSVMLGSRLDKSMANGSGSGKDELLSHGLDKLTESTAAALFSEDELIELLVTKAEQIQSTYDEALAIRQPAVATSHESALIAISTNPAATNTGSAAMSMTVPMAAEGEGNDQVPAVEKKILELPIEAEPL